MVEHIVKALSLEEIQEMSAGYPGLDPRSLEVYNALTRTARLLVAEIDRAAAERPSGMPAGRNAVLWAVIRYPGEEGITPAGIAEALDVTRATVTGLLGALEKDGLVERVHSKEDRRRVHVLPTAKAREYTQQEWPLNSADITSALSELTERDKSQLLNLLRKIRRGTYSIRSNTI